MVLWSQIPSVCGVWPRSPPRPLAAVPVTVGRGGQPHPACASVPPTACGPPSQRPGWLRPHAASSLCSGCVCGSSSHTHPLSVHPGAPGTCPPPGCSLHGWGPCAHTLCPQEALCGPPLEKVPRRESLLRTPAWGPHCRVLPEQAASLLWPPVPAEVARHPPLHGAHGQQSGLAAQPAQHTR